MHKPSLALLLTAGLLAACSSPSVSSDDNGGGGGTSGSGSTSGSAGTGSSTGSGGPPIVAPPPNTMPSMPAPNTPTENMNCGLKKYDLERKPADILIVLDRSGSMLDPFTANGAMAEKWSETVAAIDTVVSRTQASVSWGLKLFPTPMLEMCGVGDGAEVPVALNNRGMVMASMAANPSTMGLSTPTRDAIAKGAAFLKATPSTNNKFLLVATDGEPNCSAGGSRRGDAAATVAAVKAANADGIPSFIVGVATSGSTADVTLNMMATEGGRPRNDPATKYYPVASRDELVGTLDNIATQVASCTFPLNPPPPAPANVAVNVDGKRISRDTSQTNGWNYGPDNKSIVFFGAACDDLKSGAAKDVQIIMGCGDTVIP
jgi:Mg-chelatase subunit ChlD